MSLTPRQMEIASLIAHGRSYKAIARELSISTQTVKNHVHDAAARIPGPTSPRHKLMLFIFSLDYTEQDLAS